MSHRAHGLFASVIFCVAACKSEPKETPAAAPSATAAQPSASAGGAALPAMPRADSSGVTPVDAKPLADEEFGYAVAAAGERVVISAFKRAEGDAHPGSIFVYRLDGVRATLETELRVEKAHQIGNALAFDGNTIAVGAMFDSGATPETGAAYVFERDGEGWSKPVKLAAKKAKADDSFGIGVALAADSIVVSNSRESGGELHVFDKAKQGHQQHALAFPEQSGPGETIAAHGDWVVAGAQFGGKVTEQGVVHAYQRRDGRFHPAAALEDEKPAEERHFGGAVAVSARALAIASETEIALFELRDGRWQRSGRITPPIATGLADAALALSDDALAVGLPIVDEGRVLVYRKRGAGWVLDRVLRSPDGKKDDWFGFSLALSGKRLVVGAPFKAERAGAAYVVAL